MPVTPYIELLQRLIATPSVSRDEDATASILMQFLSEHGCNVSRIYNNVIARSANWSDDRPTLMLNSHHDTVKPSPGYTRNPFEPAVRGDFLYGLGSNDAGGALVSLVAAFLHFEEFMMPFNIILVLSAEEEVSGCNGIEAVLPQIGKVDMAIVGEPTSLRAAVGERGLVVLDCVASGVSGHAAREEGVNALYLALDDISRLRSLALPRVSPLLGPVKFSVTQIEGGTQHNVVPDRCRFVVDVRTTDTYTNEEIVDIVAGLLTSRVTPRSTRLRASAISQDHPLVRAAVGIGSGTFVSPTMSDMALMPFQSLKIGPGDSSRSHTADEYIRLSEIEAGINLYKSLIYNLKI